MKGPPVGRAGVGKADTLGAVPDLDRHITDAAATPRGASPIDQPHAGGPILLTRLMRRTSSWTMANLMLLITLVAAFGVFVAGVDAAGDVYEDVVDDSGVARLDQPALAWSVAHRTPWANAIWATFSNTGGPVLQPIICGALVLWLSWRWRSWTPLVLAVVAEAGALAMTVAGKDLVGRARPDLAYSIPPHEYSPSFPSGHTLNATVIAGIVCYLMLHWFRGRLARTLWVLGSAVYVAAMGFSRIFLGHHWLTDVLAAVVIGLAWLAVVIAMHRLWLVARARHGEQRWTAMLRPGPHTPLRS